MIRIAYIISAYKLPDQLIRLVLRLNTPTASFFVHVDKRTDRKIYQQMLYGLRDLHNVHFLPRHKCYWGGFGHVQATIKGINMLASSKASFDYAILLTGQDYPIKPNSYIEAELEKSAGKQFIEYDELPRDCWEHGGLDRIHYWHFRVLGRYFRFPGQDFQDSKVSQPRSSFLSPILPFPRHFPEGFKPFGGSSYWCLSQEGIQYLQLFIERNRSFINFFKYVDVPDEIFFQTIILNSPLRTKVVNDGLRYIDWKEPNAASPAILCKSDMRELLSSPKLFARKFDMTVDAEVLDLIDRHILAGK